MPETQLYGGLTRRPIFVPSVGHFRQGMLVSVPLHLDTLNGTPTGADLLDVLMRRYAGCDLVRVVAPQDDGKLEPEALNGTDRLERIGACQREMPAKPCWSRGSTISARGRVRRPLCKTSD